MTKKVELVVGAAMERSKTLVGAILEARKGHRTNAQRVIDICKDLVMTKPAQEPLAPRISEIGGIRYGRFPATQSLLNRYGDIYVFGGPHTGRSLMCRPQRLRRPRRALHFSMKI